MEFSRISWCLVAIFPKGAVPRLAGVGKEGKGEG